MTEQPPRKRFQIHLSTAIVLMFVAGALIWANVTERLDKSFYNVGEHFEGSFNDFKKHMQSGYHNWSTDPGTSFFTESYGWPYAFSTNKNTYIALNNDPKDDQIVNKRSQSYPAACIDALIAASIIFVLWFFLEWLIRRRAAAEGSMRHDRAPAAQALSNPSLDRHCDDVCRGRVDLGECPPAT